MDPLYGAPIYNPPPPKKKEFSQKTTSPLLPKVCNKWEDDVIWSKCRISTLFKQKNWTLKIPKTCRSGSNCLGRVRFYVVYHPYTCLVHEMFKVLNFFYYFIWPWDPNRSRTISWIWLPFSLHHPTMFQVWSLFVKEFWKYVLDLNKKIDFFS